MGTTFTLPDVASLGDLRTYLGRAARVEDGSVRLIADSGVLAVYTAILYPVGLLDELPDHWREIDLRTGARRDLPPLPPPPPDPLKINSALLTLTTFEAAEPHGRRKAVVSRGDGSYHAAKRAR